jgi:hypothetical protein
MEVEDVGCFAVEDQADGPLALLLLLPHLARDIITVTELVGKPLAFSVEQETTLTTKS